MKPSDREDPEILPTQTQRSLENLYLDNEHFRPKTATRILRTLPVIFIILLIACVYSIFLTLHIASLLQLDVSPASQDGDMYMRGIIQGVIFHVLFILFCVCYSLSLMTPPGTIPDSTEWIQEEKGGQQVEMKKEGTRRRCKWCDKYKPDRAHHCRQCRQCILKMDHHCPWIYNCVGWGNHKYFILCVMYASIVTVFVAICQIESVGTAFNEPQIRFGVVFLLILGEALTCLLGLISGSFFIFHMWLVTQNLSTIEFCEKHFRHLTTHNLYDRGFAKNFTSVFGTNPLLWLIPIDNRSGDGLHFNANPELLRLIDARRSFEKYSSTKKSSQNHD